MLSKGLIFMCIVLAVHAGGHHGKMKETMRQCENETGVNAKEIWMETPTAENNKSCFQLCLMQKKGLIDQAGKLNETAVPEECRDKMKQCYNEESTGDVSSEKCGEAKKLQDCMKSSDCPHPGKGHHGGKRGGGGKNCNKTKTEEPSTEGTESFDDDEP